MTATAPVHPIIFIISPPRSCSTALMRAFAARDDCIVFNEPAVPVYDAAHYPDLSKGWFAAHAPQTYAEVAARLADARRQKPVVVKEMAFAAEELFAARPDLLEDAKLILLVRDPEAVALSIYDRLQSTCDGLTHVMGYQFIAQLRPRARCIVQAEVLCSRPREELLRVCAAMDLAYSDAMMNWPKACTAYDPKVGSQIKHWHSGALGSHEFAPLKGRTDWAIVPEEARIVYFNAALLSLPYYFFVCEACV